MDDKANRKPAAAYALTGLLLAGLLTGPLHAADGGVLGWGDNSWGQTTIPPELTNAVAIAAGGSHGLALTGDGRVLGWGRNDYNQATPPEGLTNVISVAAGALHSLALRADGTIVGWGLNDAGQTTVPTGLSNAIAIAAGATHSLALRADGTVAQWGDASQGQGSVPTNLNDVVAIAAGWNQSLAVKRDGTVVGWGTAAVPDGLSNVVAVAAEGADGAVALKADGTVSGWGSTATIGAGASNIVALCAGTNHCVALRNNGTPAGWGDNTWNQTNIPGNATNVVAVVAGERFTLALLGTNAPRLVRAPFNLTAFQSTTPCFSAGAVGWPAPALQWRFNGTNLPPWVGTNAFLGLTNVGWSNEGPYCVVASNRWGSVTSATATLSLKGSVVASWGNTVYPMISGLTNVQRVALGAMANLALTSDGLVRVWGNNLYQQTNVPSGITNAVAIAAGDYHCLALRADGTVAAWGSSGTQTNCPAGLTNAVAIAAGSAYSVALKADGTVAAWGDSSTKATSVPAGLSNVVAISAGKYAPLALRGDGTVTAWGYNPTFLGYTNVPAGLTNIMAISAGSSHVLVLLQNGTVACWGNSASQTNVPAGLSNVVEIVAGQSSCFALRDDGTWVTWGPFSAETNMPHAAFDQVALSWTAGRGVGLRSENPPRFGTQPANLTVNGGTAATLAARVLGPRPMGYQWQFNGSDLAGATNATLLLSNVQPEQSGAYQLLATNRYGTVWSSNITLTVITSPVLTLQPVSQQVLPGANVIFSAAANGAPPLSCQWWWNGLPLSGQTNLTLSLTNVQSTTCGSYSISISNFYGGVISSNAALSLIDLGVALNATNLVWVTSNNPAWFPETNVTHDGFAAASSGLLRSTNQSWLKTTVIGPGTLSFWWCASYNYSGAGDFYFNINSTNTAKLGLTTGWQQRTFYLLGGTNILVWMPYWSSPYVTYYTATEWVDEVSYVYGATPGLLISGPANQTVSAGTNVTFSPIAGGTPPLSCQWFFNGVALAGFTNATLSLSDVQATNAGTYTIQVANAQGQTNASASLTVTPAAPVVVTQPSSREMVPGGQVTFSVTARGTEPFICQWYHNGSPLQNATNASLVVYPVQTNDAGAYFVTLSNVLGGFVSTNVTLTLVPTVIVAWGLNSDGQCTVPLGLTNIVAISGGSYHNLALRTDGTVAVWGDNSWGQTNIPAGLSNVAAIAGGDLHSLALRADGTIAAWGTDTDNVTNVPPSLTNAAAIAAGSEFNLAITQSGAITGWGNNFFGSLNYPANLSNVVSISAGWTRGLASCQDGSAVGWGAVTIPAGTSNVVQVAAGVFYAAVLCRNGTVVICNPTPSYDTPPADLTNAISLALGAYHFLALRADGGLTSWGVGSYGQTNVPAWLTNVVAVSCGEFHSLALLNDGSPYFTCQPWNLSANSGDTLTFNPFVRGIEPVVYQWTFNGLALPGATNSSLTLTNVPLTSAGAYQCLASNRIGWAASHVATLAVNRSTLEWTTGKNAMQWDATGFHLQLDRLSGHGAVVIYASTNLIDWQPVFTNLPAIGSFEYLDTNAARWPARFYRAVEQ